MRKVEDSNVREFNEISEKYTNDFAVVEIISIDHSKGEKTGKALWLCDSFEEAWKLSVSLEDVETMVLPGWDRISTLGALCEF